VTVCSGSCDGHGSCLARTSQSCNKYGRGELDVCLYTACNVADNTTYCAQFPSPSGVSCSTGDACFTSQMCGTSGCSQGTRVPGCTEPDVDAALGAAGGEGGASTPSATSTSHSSGACSVEGTTDGAAPFAAAAALLGLAAATCRRRVRP
jgi:hypothetical protein